MHDKPTLRQLMRERLRAIDDATRSRASAQIAQHILRSCTRESAGFCIGLFGGLKNEPDFLPFIVPALNEQGACLACFQIEAGELRPHQIHSMEDLQRGQMNVWVPKPYCPPVEIAAFDLILVPGLAFTRDGCRIGRGGGYYDRLLAHPHCRAQRIGIAYDLQIVDSIPVEPHDQRVDQIITESGLITIPGGQTSTSAH
jgi:5-formyltetrahydrofolate cyclo-ligase